MTQRSDDESGTADSTGTPGPFVPDDFEPGDAAASDETVTAVARLSEPELSTAERRRALAQVAAALRKRGFRDALRPKAAVAWLADVVVDIAPRIPIRSADRLREHFPGHTDEQIADRLIRNAARTSAGIGAVGGGVSSIKWVAPPTLLTAPVLLAAETVAVVAVELKLIAELHAIYGQPVPGTSTQRAVTLLQLWAARRGVNFVVPGRGITTVLSTAARHELRDRLARRFGRNLTTLGPLLSGAAVAAWLNRRATLGVAEAVRKDLTDGRPPAITSG